MIRLIGLQKCLNLLLKRQRSTYLARNLFRYTRMSRVRMIYRSRIKKDSQFNIQLRTFINHQFSNSISIGFCHLILMILLAASIPFYCRNLSKQSKQASSKYRTPPYSSFLMLQTQMNFGSNPLISKEREKKRDTQMWLAIIYSLQSS